VKLYLSPQRSDDELSYLFEGNTVKVTHKTFNDEKSETFDLTDIYERNEEGEYFIKSPEILSTRPISSVEEIDGEMHVVVARYHGPNPSRDVAWPDWIEVEDGATYPHPDE